MIFITGDTHRDFERLLSFCRKSKPDENDILIILGDVGLNYYGGEKDNDVKELVNSFPFTTFCIYGNHEMRPDDIPSCKMRDFHGGKVWFEEKFSKILYARDGEIYDFGGYSCIVIGGAYSIDKNYRLARGWYWCEKEQPSAEIKTYAEKQLAERDNKVDIVLSHTCPLKYEPVEAFFSGIDQSKVDKSTEMWLDAIENNTDYKKWYCGHYHIVKKIDKLQFMFEDIDVLKI